MYQLFLINSSLLFPLVFVGAVVYGTTGDIEMARFSMSAAALLVALLVLPSFSRGVTVGGFDPGAVFYIAFAMSSMLLPPNLVTTAFFVAFVALAAERVNSKEETYFDRFVASFPLVSTLIGGLMLLNRWWSSKRSRT